MKVTRCALFTILMLVSVVASSFAGPPATSKPGNPKWVAKTINNPKYRFSEVYFVTYCEIAVYRDGSGVQVLARDEGSGTKYLTQQITIQKMGDALPRKVEEYAEHDNHVVTLSGDETSSLARDIFSEKYLAMAQSLPPRIKKLFFGYFGLE